MASEEVFSAVTSVWGEVQYSPDSTSMNSWLLFAACSKVVRGPVKGYGQGNPPPVYYVRNRISPFLFATCLPQWGAVTFNISFFYPSLLYE